MNGQYIDWNQLRSLFEKISEMRTRSQGLTLVPKLKREHVVLTSFSLMRVDLAAQVIKYFDYSILLYTYIII